MTAEPIGVWRLRSFEFTDVAGDAFHPLGTTPAGGVVFTQDRHASFAFMASKRAGFAADDLFVGSLVEKAAAFESYVSFGGRYEIRADAIIVRVEYSLFPNWVGRDQIRHFELNGDRLTLRTSAPMLFGGVLRTAEARLERTRSTTQ